jgi:hypothetical protein
MQSNAQLLDAPFQPENKNEQHILGYWRGCRGRAAIRVSEIRILTREIQGQFDRSML